MAEASAPRSASSPRPRPLGFFEAIGFSFGVMAGIPPSAWRADAALRGAATAVFSGCGTESAARLVADFADAAE